MDALAALRAKITNEWTVDVLDHDYLNDSREGAKLTVFDDSVIIKPRRPWSSQGRTFPTMHLAWDDRDWEVDGRTLTLYRTATSITSRSTPGERQKVKTFTFHPPRGH